MEKIKYTLRFNRKNQLNKHGQAPIQIECYLNGKRKYFDTKIKVSPNQWHEKTKTIKGTPNAIQQNALISEMVRTLENYEIERINSGKAINLEMLYNAFNSPKNNTFNAWCASQIDKDTVKISTKKALLLTLKHLNNFNKNLSFSDIDFDFLKSFERYLQGQKLQPNSIATYLRLIRKFVNLAINSDLMNINQYPFRKFKITAKKTDKAFLLASEIEQIENVVLTDKKLIFARDLFLFSVYTGLRYSDIVTLRPSNIVTIKGEKWVQKHQQKTDEKIMIPIYLLFNGKPLKIIENNYIFGSMQVFKFITNQTLNRHIKQICKLAGIEKHITFHSARHTTATYLLSKGVNIYVVQKILGHSKIDTTQIYTHLIDETMINSLQSVNF
jgi:putative integrase/transposase